MSQDYKYAINLNSGRVTFYNREVASQTAYAAIPTEIALAVGRKEVDWRSVVELIHKKRNNDPTFSWEVFDKLRDRQNIRRAKYDPETLGEESETVNEEKMLEVGDISLDELASPAKTAAKTDPKPVRKTVAATDNVSRVPSSSRPSGDVKLTI